MSKLTWLMSCMTEAELDQLEVPLSREDRQTMVLRELLAAEIPNFGQMEGKVQFEIKKVRHRCWHHLLKPVNCVEIVARYIVDINSCEGTYHDYSITVCPECKKEYSKVNKTSVKVSRRSDAKG